MTTCQAAYAQYASREACLGFCTAIPLGKPGDTDTHSVACRQYYAGSPAKTDAITYCRAAGPFGGGICGERCTTLCQLALATCPPDAGTTPYLSQPECATACATFSFREPSVDGGGEGPTGPTSGDTLNCRLFHLRGIVQGGGAAGCSDVGAESAACR
jgi:hypothetical protein